MASLSQWLTSRSLLSDWLTSHETEKRSMVSLEHQGEALAVHPLPLGLDEICMGLQQLGRDDVMRSHFGQASVTEALSLDLLGTEDQSVLLDDETGMVLGVA